MKRNILSPGLTYFSEPDARTGDVYLCVATSGGEKEIFGSSIIIIPPSRLITRCALPIFHGTVNITYDGDAWRWSREGDGAQGEVKLYKLQLWYE